MARLQRLCRAPGTEKEHELTLGEKTLRKQHKELVPLTFTCLGSLKGKLRRKWSVLITLGLGANI